MPPAPKAADRCTIETDAVSRDRFKKWCHDRDLKLRGGLKHLLDHIEHLEATLRRHSSNPLNPTHP